MTKALPKEKKTRSRIRTILRGIFKALLIGIMIIALLSVISCLYKKRGMAKVAALAATRQVPILPHPGKDEDPSLVRGEDGTYWLVWFSDRGGKPYLWMTRSRDGQNWDKPWQVTQGPGGDFYPSLVQKKDGRFCLVWFRQKMGIRNILFAEGDRNGKNWTQPVGITKEFKNNWAPCIIEDAKGVLWIVWASGKPGQKDLFLVRSEDGGKTWSPRRQITNDPDEDDFPYIAQEDSGDFILVWTRFRQKRPKSWLPNSSSQTVMSRSKDGFRWEKPQALTQDAFVDAFPIIYSSAPAHNGAQGTRHFAAWTTDRYTKLGDLAGMALSKSMTYPATPFQINAPVTHGYTARLAPIDTEGRYLMVWVSKNGKGDLEIFRQFVQPLVPEN